MRLSGRASTRLWLPEPGPPPRPRSPERLRLRSNPGREQTSPANREPKAPAREWRTCGIDNHALAKVQRCKRAIADSARPYRLALPRSSESGITRANGEPCCVAAVRRLSFFGVHRSLQIGKSLCMSAKAPAGLQSRLEICKAVIVETLPHFDWSPSSSEQGPLILPVRDTSLLQLYARDYQMAVLMANY